MSEALMIHDKRIVPRRYAPDLAFDETRAPTPGSAIAWAVWKQLDAAGADLKGVGVILDGASDLQGLQEVLDRVAFVALHFPKFTDGRCYSHARRIRALWGYQGDILAFGDVLRDQLVYMARSGINAFHLRDDQDVRASLAAFALFTEFYQYDWGQPQA